jgi:hypothetical protein
MSDDPISGPVDQRESARLVVPASKESEAIICPVCGVVAVQEKCKVICRSEICRGRIVMNCSEF